MGGKMKTSLTKKITLIATLTVFISGVIIGIANYYFSYKETLKSAGIELTRCANIVTGMLSVDALAKLIAGEETFLPTIEEELEWTISHKHIFSASYILAIDGTVVAADSHLKDQGYQPGDTFIIEAAIMEQLKNGEVAATAVYTQDDHKKITGYAPIFKDHNPQKELIAINAIDFDGKIVSERTWEANKMTILLSMILPFFAALITSIFTRKLLRPIKGINEQVAELAKGNLAIDPLPVNTADELGVLSSQFNLMVEGLQTLIRQVEQTTTQINENSQEVYVSAESAQLDTQSSSLSTAESLEQVTENILQQTNLTQQANTDLKLIAESIQKISQHIEDVSTSSYQATQLSSEGQDVVHQTLQKMQQIEKATTAANQITYRLNQKLQEIDQIITLINNISNQTNLLALNATIEAAREGEHGKGFLVVSDEIRKLAEETKAATLEIGNLIAKIQEESTSSIEKSEQGKQAVVQGLLYIQQTNESFDGLSKNATNTAQEAAALIIETTNIKDSMQQLVAVIESVTELSHQVSESTDIILESSEHQTEVMQEFVDVAKSLSDIATQLKISIEQFQL